MAKDAATNAKTLLALKRRLLIGFAVTILIPFIQGNVRFIKFNYVNENRPKLPRPTDYREILDAQSGFPARFEAYFNDVFGLRDFFIRLKGQFDYSLFGVSDNVLIGREGWLFYKYVNHKELVASDRQPETAYADFFQDLRRLNAKLAERGASLVLLPILMKDTVYREFLPSTAARRPAVTGMDRLRAFLAGQKEVRYLDAPALQLEWKANGREVFFRTDFHWKNRVAVDVARALVEELARISKIKARWPHVVEFREKRGWHGNEADQLAVFTEFNETEDPIVEVNLEKYGKTAYSEHGLRAVYEALPDSPQKNLLPGVLLVGNSFTHPMLRAGIMRVFKRFERVPPHEMERLAAGGPLPEGTRFVVVSILEKDLAEMMRVLRRP